MKKHIIVLLSIAALINSQLHSAALKRDKDYNEKLSLVQNFPILNNFRLTLSRGRPFFTVWKEIGDKGLVLKSVLLDPYFKNAWLNNNSLNFYNELNTLFQQNKNKMHEADVAYLATQLASLKKGIDVMLTEPPAPKKINIPTLEIHDKSNVLSLMVEIDNFQDFQALAMTTINKLIELYQARQITQAEMKQSFISTRNYFINPPEFAQKFYSQDPKENKAQKDLLIKILDAYINNSEAIAKNN